MEAIAQMRSGIISHTPSGTILQEQSFRNNIYSGLGFTLMLKAS
jgi:hypothetical protein